MSKRIVLFADGTGNSRAAQFRTNVWKMYDALDLTPGGDQIAYYHDGVGTSAFAPLKILGSVFGYGVAANVRTLYAFLCRNYEAGDDIYIFGFSRGAFTARLLAALISHMGVPSLRSDAEIDRRAAHALSDYRRHRNRPRYGRIRRSILAGWERLTRPFSRPPVEQLEPARRRVAFVGVWDTVSAYGGPIVETVRAWDRWVFPLSFADYQLPNNVECARHALSLDEEREAFAPLLWDETRSGARIRQVWFAGVHSDVGGGYPDQGLSNVPLLWMMDEVASAPAGPLRFVTESRDRIRREANLLGPRHDSRSGVAIGYRYQPRWLSTYAQPSHGVPSRDPATGEGVMLMRPTVHSSVIERQRHGLDGYAPIVLPQSFADTDGGAHSLDPGLQRHVVRLSLRRRRLQFMLLLTGLLMVISPGFRSPWSQDFYDGLAGPAEVVKPLLWLGYGIDYLNQMLGKVVHGVIAVVPGLPDWVADAYASSGGYLILGALALLVIVRRSAGAAQRIEQESQAMWRVPSYPQAALPPSAWSSFWWPLRRFVRWRFVPDVIGIGYWLVMAWALVALVNQVSLSLYTRDPHWCPEEARSNVFHTRERCHALHQQVYEGQAFHLQIAVPPTPSARWADEPTAATPAGFTYLDSLGQQIAARSATGVVRVTFAHLFGTALRQNIGERWFMPIVAIRPTGAIVAEDAGRAWVRTAPVRMQAGDDGIYRGTFIAPTSGTAYLYVNDVVLPFMPWRAPAYDDNCGWAYVRLTPAYRRGGRSDTDFIPDEQDVQCTANGRVNRR